MIFISYQLLSITIYIDYIDISDNKLGIYYKNKFNNTVIILINDNDFDIFCDKLIHY